MGQTPRKKKNNVRWDKRRILVSVVAGFLALMLILPIVTQIVQVALAVSAAEIQEMKDDVAALEREEAALQRELDALQDQQDAKLEEKKILEQKIMVLEEQIAIQEQIIADYDLQIAECEADLEAARQQEQLYYDLFCSRVRNSEEQSPLSFLSILFDAASFMDFLDRMVFIADIARYDRDIMDKLAESRQLVEDAKTALEEKRQEQQDAMDVLVEQRTQLEADMALVDEAIAEIEANKGVYEAQIHELEEDMGALEDDIRDAERQMDASRVPIGNGGYIWPLPASHRITSRYGYRNCPYHGRELHAGIDVGAPSGSDLLAAKGGVVLISKYSSSYGHYVVISHGDGTRTLYAHMSRRLVSVGQTVTQGQLIGYVGSTGNSTGPHLHFEIWLNSSKSSRVDPLQYFDF